MTDPNETKITCPECKGLGVVDCLCNGENYDEYGDPCFWCDGTNKMDCPLCAGDREIFPSELED